MGLQLNVSIPDPDTRGVTSITDPVARIENLRLGMSDLSGELTVWVCRNQQAATVLGQPVRIDRFTMGKAPFEEGVMGLLSDPEFAAAWMVIETKLTEKLKTIYTEATEVVLG